MSNNSIVASPCISVCLLDEHDICVGCYRSSDEITQWMACGNEEKQAILKKSYERMKLDNTQGFK